MTYAERIVALYEGESYGEHLFNLLAEHEGDLQLARMWRGVAAVERLTGARIKPYAERHDADLDAQQRHGHARAAEQFAAFEGQSSREVLEYYRQRVPANLARLRELESMAPTGDKAVLGQFIAHSEAFGACVERWLDDDHSGALEALEAYLSSKW